MNHPITFHALTRDHLDAISEHQRQYIRAYPGVSVVPGEAYLSPAFEEGRLVQCASDSGGCLLGYAVYYPVGDLAWVEIRSLPGLPRPESLRDPLFDWLTAQARERGQKRLAFQYNPQEQEGIAFACRAGAAYTYSIYTMQRPLAEPVPDCALNPAYTLRHLRLTDKAGQRQYVEARNECFPEAPISMEEWQYFAGSPWWAEGICMAAFSGDILAGSVTVYWEPGSTSGFTEYIFTRSPYRGKGLARALLAESLRYLQNHNLQHARLDVKAENETALKLYTGLGYQVTHQSRVYEATVPRETPAPAV